MQGDTFTSSNINNKSNIQHDLNFFMQPQQLVTHQAKQDKSRSLNGYDMNLLEEDAYKDINDETFKIEYKINKLEKDIAELENKILAADEIGDVNTSSRLSVIKKQMEADLHDLNEVYKEISLSAKISDSVTSIFLNKFRKSGLKINNICNYFVSILPAKISSLITLKQSLEKLENINKNVDELVSMQIPYGEAADKYSQLSKYIAKANNIQSELSKYIK